MKLCNLKNTFAFLPLILVLCGSTALSSSAITSQYGVSVSSSDINYGDLIAADDNLYFGESYYADRQEFHSKIKKKILGAAGDYAKKVGNNPDIKVNSKKIVLTGTGDFKGKSFETGLAAGDYLLK